MDEQSEIKLMNVLEYFLSLHEADEVYNAIFNDDVTPDQLEKLLDSYREPQDVRELCSLHSGLLFDNYRNNSLNDALKELGFELVDDSIDGEYADIQAYYTCLIKPFEVD